MTIKTCSFCQEAKDLSQYHKGKGYKGGVRSYCKSCAKDMNAKRYKEKREHILSNSAEWSKNNVEKRRAIGRKYRSNNKDKVNQRTREWFKNNPDKARAYVKNRRAKTLGAMPPWLTKEQLDAIDQMYSCSKIMSEKFNVEYHVDHIVPLKGENICGLHVPWNLQLLEAGMNISKGNREDRSIIHEAAFG